MYYYKFTQVKASELSGPHDRNEGQTQSVNIRKFVTLILRSYAALQ